MNFTLSLERVLFEFAWLYPVIKVLYSSDLVCKRSVNTFDGLHVFCQKCQHVRALQGLEHLAQSHLVFCLVHYIATVKAESGGVTHHNA